jgi:hypothetical protein
VEHTSCRSSMGGADLVSGRIKGPGLQLHDVDGAVANPPPPGKVLAQEACHHRAPWALLQVQTTAWVKGGQRCWSIRWWSKDGSKEYTARVRAPPFGQQIQCLKPVDRCDGQRVVKREHACQWQRHGQAVLAMVYIHDSHGRGPVNGDSMLGDLQ